MELKFFTAAGVGLFSRSDIEEGHWVQEEMTVTATFPFVASKKIEIGQRFAFADPATGDLVAFEVRNVTNIEPDHYQQIIAEDIALAELNDEHINRQEITNETPANALSNVLAGTLWSVGNSSVTDQQSCDISRGNVWQAVKTIEQNWNVYIIPRITITGTGNIGTRKLDIYPAQGTWRGVRLSIDKNMSDSSVQYDDSEVYTALYGYGGTVDKPQQGGDDQPEELTFAEVVWSATSSHPAKPSGQTYLEDPDKTALYGRNGRAKFGYYQNGNIDDAEVLLEKTWETLKQVSQPKISISGTVTDLYRLGYKDEPMRLHDTVIIDIPETGELFQKEIIRLDIDLLNPSANRPEIGDYVPNIVYINREANESSGGGGGGGGHGQDNDEEETAQWYTQWVKTNQMIGMIVGQRNGDLYIKRGEIILAINDDGTTSAHINADVIDIDGVVTALEAYDISCGNLTTGSITCTDVTADGGAVSGQNVFADVLISCDGDITCDGDMTCGGLTVNGDAATWSTKTITTYTLSSQGSFISSDGPVMGYLVTGYSSSTIHYLGGADT